MYSGHDYKATINWEHEYDKHNGLLKGLIYCYIMTAIFDVIVPISELDSDV
jgi:hypothetical protein